MIRVAFDVSSTRGHKTGIGVYTASLLDALHTYAPEIKTLELGDGAAVAQRTDLRIWREQFALPRLAARVHADLLHLTGFAAPLSGRVPVLLTVMDLIGVLFSRNFPLVSRLYWSRYLPGTLRAARHLVTLSEHTRRDIMRLTSVPADRITVIPPGLDRRFQRIADPDRLDLVRTRLRLGPYYLFVSTLEPRKGIDTLLQAFARVASGVPESLVIVGKRGWYYEQSFAQVQALGVTSRVRFLDYVSDDDLPVLYNLATAFVFPSRYEGFGLTPLEAMACGAPVISSNAASLPEVIGDAGILVTPEDVNGFAQAMRTLAFDTDRRADLSARGLKRAHFFSWQRAIEALVPVYHQVLAHTQNKSPHADHL